MCITSKDFGTAEFSCGLYVMPQQSCLHKVTGSKLAGPATEKLLKKLLSTQQQILTTLENGVYV